MPLGDPRKRRPRPPRLLPSSRTMTEPPDPAPPERPAEPEPAPTEIRETEVHEVEAVPLTASEARGPTLDVPPPVPPAEPAAPPPLSAGPERSAAAGVPSPPGGGGMPPEPPPIGAPTPSSKPRWRDHAWAAVCHLMLFLVIPTVFLGAVITFFLWQTKGRRDPHVE